MLVWRKLLHDAAYGDDDPKTFGAGSRKGKGRELARALDLSATAVYNLLSMNGQPRVETIQQLSKYFMVPVPYLLLESGEDDVLNLQLLRVLELDRTIKEQVAAFIATLPASPALPP